MALRDDVLKYYPTWAWALQIPELSRFLEDSVAAQKSGDGGWDAATFQQKLQDTSWWKGNTPALREFQQRQQDDPTAVEQRLRERMSKLWDQSRSLGLNLGADVIEEQARLAEQLGLNDNQITDALVERARAQGYQGVNGNLGAISTNIAQLKGLASSYYALYDDKTLFDFSTQIANGERTINDFEPLMKEQAKARFSYDENMVKQIDAGFKPTQLLQSQQNTLAQLLEVSADQINLADPKWSQVLDYSDPTTGARRVATVSETAKLARQTAEWTKTNNGVQAGVNLKAQLSQMFQGR